MSLKLSPESSSMSLWSGYLQHLVTQAYIMPMMNTMKRSSRMSMNKPEARNKMNNGKPIKNVKNAVREKVLSSDTLRST